MLKEVEFCSELLTQLVLRMDCCFDGCCLGLNLNLNLNLRVDEVDPALRVIGLLGSRR